MPTPKNPESHPGKGRVRVECLGPLAIKRRHWFYSTNELSHRICAACRKVQDDRRCGPNLMEPCKAMIE